MQINRIFLDDELLLNDELVTVVGIQQTLTCGNSVTVKTDDGELKTVKPEELEEPTYKLTPESILWCAIQERSGMEIDFDIVKNIFKDFMDGMIKNGYIAEKQED